MTDLISRADAIEAVASITMSIHLSDVICDKLLALPSAEIPTESTNTPTNTPTDLISRADAIACLSHGEGCGHSCRNRINALPSADADGEDLIIKCAKGIQDGLYNIKDGKLFKYKGKGGTVRTYPIVPSADAVSREFYEDAVKANIGLVIENRQLKEQIESADAVPQLKQTDTLIIADALRYLAKDTERHLVDRTRADALRQQFLKYGASMCKGGEE